MDIQYYMVVDGRSVGPFSLIEVMMNPDLRSGTLVWKTGMSDWKPACEFPELASKFEGNQVPPEYKDFASNPQYKTDHRYETRNPRHESYGNYARHENHDPYRQGYRPALKTNWLPWAIIATILGFFTSCIGAVFGIIGIVQANKANNFYATGYDVEGDSANSTARIMTIIGLVLAGIGILVAGWFGFLFSGPGHFTSFGNWI